MEITNHNKNGRLAGYKKYVYGRLFHLGSDKDFAIRFATALVAKADLLKLSGGSWTDPIIEECRSLAKGLSPDPTTTTTSAPSVPVVSVKAPEPPVDPLTVHEAIKKFLEAEELRVRANQIGRDHYVTRRDFMNHAKAAIAQDVMLISLTLSDLKRWTSHFMSRPVSLHTKKSISANYASGVVKAIRSFVDWCDAEGHFFAPRRWTDAFKGASAKKLMTLMEKKKTATKFPTLSLRDAQILWQISFTSNARTMLGLGLWCGMTQKEIATCLVDDFTEVDGQMYCEKFRNKTGVLGRWWLPAEVAKEIRTWLDRTKKLTPTQNPQGLAFLTHGERPMPLIHFGVDGTKNKSDAVRCVWQRLMAETKEYGVPHLSFKYLRKTLSQEVRNHLGAEYAVAFCSHSPRDIQTQAYTKPDLAKLEQTMKAVIYPVWQQMFVRVDLCAIMQAVKLKNVEHLKTRAA